MPRLARWFIKAGLLYFALAVVAGVLIQARTEIDLPSWAGTLNPVYVHLLTVGWITQLIFGVAYWMFPKFSKEHPRGSEKLGWATFILLNIGLILRIICEPRVALRSEPDLGWLLAASAVLQTVAGWLFVLNTWLRVKER
ncbi:MAG: cbb3-type cytochrome c oxidase subunit I [Anaerolineae bacterium]|nr:cbb3-type cytochrome c oxidase subunit I [Anaerolineae bacterium]MEB2289082.1 cbb3-type cytochrome c oxidase subunit I [Anaerolineae bacterium]